MGSAPTPHRCPGPPRTKTGNQARGSILRATEFGCLPSKEARPPGRGNPRAPRSVASAAGDESREGARADSLERSGDTVPTVVAWLGRHDRSYLASNSESRHPRSPLTPHSPHPENQEPLFQPLRRAQDPAPGSQGGELFATPAIPEPPLASHT